MHVTNIDLVLWFLAGFIGTLLFLTSPWSPYAKDMSKYDYTKTKDEKNLYSISFGELLLSVFGGIFGFMSIIVLLLTSLVVGLIDYSVNCDDSNFLSRKFLKVDRRSRKQEKIFRMN